jgi:hypothetical protein
MGASTRNAPLLALSAGLNVLLVVALLAHQQFDSALSAQRSPTTTWCPPRPTSLPGATASSSSEAAAATVDAAAAARIPSVAATSPSPPPMAVAATRVPTISEDALGAAVSTDERRLKGLWEHPNDQRTPRARLVEIHDSRWAFLDDRLLARGLSTVGDPLRLRCLAEKLLAGQPSRLSVLGGSVSFGTTFTTSRSRALFHWKTYQYLNASFPTAPGAAPHEHFMGAVPASGPSYMEHCVAWHLPAMGADIILVEYAVNFDSVSDDAQSFERLIRRLLRLPNHPAIIIVNTMELVPPGGRLPWEPDDGSSYPSAKDLSFEYRSTGAEDAIHAIADYYAVPCVSLRGALFSELKSNASRFKMKQIFHDRHHPGAWGHSLMAQMVVTLLKDAVIHAQQDALRHAQQLRAGTGGGGGGGRGGGLAGPKPSCELARNEQHGTGGRGPALYAPLFSRGDEAEIGACYKDRELASRIHSARGFSYLVEGTDQKMKPGVIGTRAGDNVQFCIDVSRLDVNAGFVFILGHLISYEHMGVARISCVGECECEATELDAHVQGGKFSVFKAKTFSAKRVAPRAGGSSGGGGGGGSGAPPCGCKIDVTILPRTGSGEHKFKVLSLMTAAKEGSLRYGHQAGFNNRWTDEKGRIH